MMQITDKVYLRFERTDFNSDVLEATDQLFKSRPWRVVTDGPQEEQGGPEEKYQVWADKVCTALNVPQVLVEVATDQTDSVYTSDRIHIHKPSVTQLFRCFYEHYLQHKMDGGQMTPEDVQNALGHSEAWCWAYSLFYLVRPEQFKDQVRKGSLPLADANDFRLERPNFTVDDEIPLDDRVIQPANDASRSTVARPPAQPERARFSPAAQNQDRGRCVGANGRPCPRSDPRTRRKNGAGQFQCADCSSSSR